MTYIKHCFHRLSIPKTMFHLRVISKESEMSFISQPKEREKKEIEKSLFINKQF